MKTLKKVDPASAAKVAAVLGIIWGLLVAIVITFVSTSFTGYMGRFYSMFGTMMPVVGYTALVTLPISYGLSGLVCGYVGSLVYNLVAKQVGGIKVDLK